MRALLGASSALSRRTLTTVWAVIVGFSLAGGVAGADILSFYQANISRDGLMYNNTAWKALDLTYMGQESITYLNVAVDG